jgi:hypothetical protein
MPVMAEPPAQLCRRGLFHGCQARSRLCIDACRMLQCTAFITFGEQRSYGDSLCHIWVNKMIAYRGGQTSWFPDPKLLNIRLILQLCPKIGSTVYQLEESSSHVFSFHIIFRNCFSELPRYSVAVLLVTLPVFFKSSCGHANSWTEVTEKGYKTGMEKAQSVAC